MPAPKHNPMPEAWVSPDTLAQAAHYDYEEAEAAATMGMDESAKAAAAEKASEAVGGLRSTGAVLEGTAAAAGDKLAAAKDTTAQTTADLTSSARDTAADVGHKLTATAEVAAARAAEAAQAASEKAHEAQMGIVGEMRDAGTMMADSVAAAGEKLGFGGKKE